MYLWSVCCMHARLTHSCKALLITVEWRPSKFMMMMMIVRYELDFSTPLRYRYTGCANMNFDNVRIDTHEVELPVSQFESYRLTDIHTYIHTYTYRQTDRQDQHYIPRRSAGGQTCANLYAYSSWTYIAGLNLAIVTCNFDRVFKTFFGIWNCCYKLK